MEDALSIVRITEQDLRISEAVERERPRLRSFIRRRVADERDVEDILQDVFAELVETYRLARPVEQAGAWLFRVARNRITDLFRKRRPEALRHQPAASSGGEEEGSSWEDLLPSPDVGPEAAYARQVLMEEIDDALDELPEGQRDVFVAHELDGRSFREMAAATGLSVNTLLSRKHYAVQHLRRRLQAVHDEIMNKRG
jgi:RNA polymerase sigma factor (sigma-70 family)